MSSTLLTLALQPIIVSSLFASSSFASATGATTQAVVEIGATSLPPLPEEKFLLEEEVASDGLSTTVPTELNQACRDYLRAALRFDGVRTVEIRTAGSPWTTKVATAIGNELARCGVKSRQVTKTATDTGADLVLECGPNGQIRLIDPLRGTDWYTRDFEPPQDPLEVECRKLAVRFLKNVVRDTEAHVSQPFKYTIAVHRIRSDKEIDQLRSTLDAGELESYGSGDNSTAQKSRSATFRLERQKRNENPVAIVKAWNTKLAESKLVMRLVSVNGNTADVVLGQKVQQPQWIALTSPGDAAFEQAKTERTSYWNRNERRNAVQVVATPSVASSLTPLVSKHLANGGAELLAADGGRKPAYRIDLKLSQDGSETIAELTSVGPSPSLIGVVVWSDALGDAMEQEWNPKLHGEGEAGPARYLAGELLRQLDEHIAGKSVVREVFVRFDGVANYEQFKGLLDRVEGRLEGVQQIELDGSKSVATCWLRYTGTPNDLVKNLNEDLKGAATVSAVGSGTITVKRS